MLQVPLCSWTKSVTGCPSKNNKTSPWKVLKYCIAGCWCLRSAHLAGRSSCFQPAASIMRKMTHSQCVLSRCVFVDHIGHKHASAHKRHKWKLEGPEVVCFSFSFCLCIFFFNHFLMNMTTTPTPRGRCRTFVTKSVVQYVLGGELELTTKQPAAAAPVSLLFCACDVMLCFYWSRRCKFSHRTRQRWQKANLTQGWETTSRKKDFSCTCLCGVFILIVL